MGMFALPTINEAADEVDVMQIWVPSILSAASIPLQRACMPVSPASGARSDDDCWAGSILTSAQAWFALGCEILSVFYSHTNFILSTRYVLKPVLIQRSF